MIIFSPFAYTSNAENFLFRLYYHYTVNQTMASHTNFLVILMVLPITLFLLQSCPNKTSSLRKIIDVAVKKVYFTSIAIPKIFI